MQQQNNTVHKYFGSEHNDSSSLVTSVNQDSPKREQDHIEEIPHIKQFNNQLQLENEELVTEKFKAAYQIEYDQNKLPKFNLIIQNKYMIQNIFNCIEIIGNSNQFFCIMKQNTQIILLKQLNSSMKEQCQKIICRSNKQSKNCIIIVRYEFQTENLIVQAHSGDAKTNEIFLIDLTHKIKECLNDENYYKEIAIQHVTNEFDVHDLEQDIYQNPYYLDAAAVAMIYKFVKQPQIQKKIQNTMNPIVQSIKELNQKSTKKSLEKEIIKIGQFAQSFHEEIISLKNHNLTKIQNQPLFPYYRLAIEKYLFEQVYQLLYSLYIGIYQKKEELVNNKRAIILQKYNPQQIMKYLDIKDRFTTLNNHQIQAYNQNRQVDPPYIKAIDEMNKINLMKSPREKLKCIQLMLCMMKSDAVEFNKNKEELTAMDDELPIIIYIVLMSKFKNQYAEIQFIEDFSNTDQTIENERRSLTNILVSLDYIANEWEII